MPPASPPIFSDLNALFLLAVGAGYALPWRDPERYRGYMWVMGPGLKGAGAVTFLLDYLLRDSPTVVPAVCRQRRRAGAAHAAGAQRAPFARRVSQR